LGNVLGSVDFAGYTYPLNPGMDQTFPWLSGIARNYQQYRMNGVVFNYVSTSAFALGTTNSALGKVILATNYNAEDPPYTSTTGALATQFSNYCRPADSIAHAIECAPTQTANNVYYVRTDLDGEQKDLRITDLGFTQISTEGMQSTSEVGGLWISYDITLYKPIINPQNAISDGFDQILFQSEVGNFFIAKQYIRSNTLGGMMINPTGAQFDYQFNRSISQGYFLSILEFDPGPDNKVNYINVGSGFHTYQNCQLITDADKNGPFNGAYIGQSSATLSSLVGTPFSSGPDLQANIVEVIQVTGPNACLTLTNLASVGSDALQWRWSMIPISYRTKPEFPIENYVEIPVGEINPQSTTTTSEDRMIKAFVRLMNEESEISSERKETKVEKWERMTRK
jgi:hypothetical protein